LAAKATFNEKKQIKGVSFGVDVGVIGAFIVGGELNVQLAIKYTFSD
jgi:hypothetical protein